MPGELNPPEPTNLPAQSPARGIKPTRRGATDLGYQRYGLNPTLRLSGTRAFLRKPNIFR